MHIPMNRRQFLKGACMSGITLTLDSALPIRVYDDPCTQSVSLGVLDNPQLVDLARNGMGPLWVAGQTLNSFAHHLRFINLPPHLTTYLQNAGGDWKSLLQAKGLWETIPPQIRAGGPKETLRFLNGKDWSHHVPRSQGGPTTADNGIFELKLLNRSRGPRTMTGREIAAARAAIGSDVFVSVVRQTLGAMVKGAIISVIINGIFACLECGLQYAEKKITWEAMVTKIIKRILIAGGLSFVITGILVGLGLLFPGLIPLLAVLIFVAQIVGLVFLAKHAVSLAKRYWALLERHGLDSEACRILGQAAKILIDTIDELDRSIAARIFEWIRSLPLWFTRDRAGSDLLSHQFVSGRDGVWVGLASQTHLASTYASELVSPLRVRGYAFDRQNILHSLDLPAVNLPEIIASIEELKKLIVRTVRCEYTEALRTLQELRKQLIICWILAELNPSDLP